MQISIDKFRIMYGPLLDGAGSTFTKWAEGIREEGNGLYSAGIEEWIAEYLVDLDDFEFDLIKPQIDDIIDTEIFDNNFTIVY